MTLRHDCLQVGLDYSLGADVGAPEAGDQAERCYRDDCKPAVHNHADCKQYEDVQVLLGMGENNGNWPPERQADADESPRRHRGFWRKTANVQSTKDHRAQAKGFNRRA